MSDWIIHPWNVQGFVNGFVFLALALNLSMIRSKSATTWLVLGVLYTTAITNVLGTLMVISANSGWQGAVWNRDFFQVLSSSLSAVTWTLFVAVIYRIGSVRLPREEKVAIGISIIVFGFWAYSVATSDPSGDATWPMLVVWIALFGWTLFVLYRKWKRTKPDDLKSLATYKAFVWFALFSLSIVLTLAVLTAADAPSIQELFVEVVSALFTIAVALLFLQFVPETTSMEAKFVGVGFLVVLAMTQLEAIPYNTNAELRQQYLPSLEVQSLTFVSLEDGGYRAEGAPYRFHDVLGDTLGTTDEFRVAIKPQFPVVAFGQERDSVYVTPNGKLAFERIGDHIDGVRWIHDIEVPSVSALDIDLDPSLGGAVVGFSTADSLMITWDRIPEFRQEDSVGGFVPVDERLFSAQLVLRRDGSITVTRGESSYRHRAWQFGLTPGSTVLQEHGTAPDLTGVTGAFGNLDARHLPVTAGPNELLMYGERNHSQYLAWSRAETIRILRNAFIGFFLVLLLVPAYFRFSIRRRLFGLVEGLKRVNAGDLEKEVPVVFNDEVGQLSASFNEMTASLRGYAHNMEDLVEARTAELKATQAQLVEQEKLASLGSLTAGIAHEIKNPLNFVNNFAEVGGELADELAEAIAAGRAEEAAQILEELKANATQIAKHGKRADSIVQGMMQHARGGASDMETVVVNDFLEEYANLSWHGRRARDHGFQAEVKREFDPEAGSLQAMPQELGRVVLNLLNNAFDAVAQTEGARITLTSQRTANKVVITVADNGPGIPEDIRAKIFEPFFTTKATGEGTGLGLSLSYDIVTKGHGGTMTVGESPEGGALFTIIIPGAS